MMRISSRSGCMRIRGVPWRNRSRSCPYGRNCVRNRGRTPVWIDGLVRISLLPLLVDYVNPHAQDSVLVCLFLELRYLCVGGGVAVEPLTDFAGTQAKRFHQFLFSLCIHDFSFFMVGHRGIEPPTGWKMNVEKQ